MSSLIHEKMCEVMSEVGSIGKDQVNQQQRYAFRGIEDVYAAVHNSMIKHGIFNTCQVLETSCEQVTNSRGTQGYRVVNRYRYTFHATDGSSIATEAIGEAVDYGDKAANKAASISHKYAIIQAFCIPTKDVIPDPDKESHNLKKPTPAPPPMSDVRRAALTRLKEARKAVSDTIRRYGLPTSLDEVMDLLSPSSSTQYWMTEADLETISATTILLKDWVKDQDSKNIK